MSFSTQIGHGTPSSNSKPGGWSSELGQESTAHPLKEILTCMRGRLSEAVSKCCCQEILLLKQTQTQPQGADVNHERRGVRTEINHFKSCEHIITDKKHNL